MTTTDKSITIMQIIPSLGPGGAEQGCVDMAAAIVKSGAQALVVSNGGARIHELERIGAVHINMQVDSKNPLIMLKNIAQLRTLIKRYDVDIVHVRSRAPAWSAYYACKGTDAHFMTTCHAPYKITNVAKRLYNSIMARGERVIAISGYVQNYLQENYTINPSRVRLVHRGLALEKFHPTAVTPERLIQLAKQWRLPDGANIIMLPARLTRWKGHHVLIEAMNLLHRKDLFCVIIGSDQGRSEYREELEETIQSKNLGGQIRIVDHCNDMPAAYMLASVVVCPSTEPEGFGRIPIEAQAMGRPIIAADHGGAQETIMRGRTGWLIPPGKPEELAAAITQVLELDPGQRSILATRAMSHIAENFTVTLMCEKTLDVYAELLRGKIAPMAQPSAPEDLIRTAAE